LPGVAEAPMIATVFGSKKGANFPFMVDSPDNRLDTVELIT